MASVRHFVTVLGLVAAAATTGCGDPPDKEMQQAQGAIDAAKAAGADQYARDEFAAAQDALKKSNDAVEQRDYRQALNYALDSRERAQTAAKQAAENRAVARSDADKALADAANALNDAEQRLKAAEAAHVPPKVLADPKERIASGAEHLQNLRAVFAQGKYAAVAGEAQAMATYYRALARDLEKPTKAPPRKPVIGRGRERR